MIDYLAEQLSPLGIIRTKRMFGSDCLFLNGTMIAIIKDDDIFIKKLHCDDNDKRFGYLRKDKTIYLNYVLIDNAMLDDGDELVELVKSFLIV